MNSEWRADLRLELEGLIDRFVVQGVGHEDVLKVARERIVELEKSRHVDPDPAEDEAVVDEPANDWPAAT